MIGRCLIKQFTIHFHAFSICRGAKLPDCLPSEDKLHKEIKRVFDMERSVSNTSNVTTDLGTEPLEPVLLRTVASFVSASLICLLIIGAFIANTFVCLAVYKQRSARRITRYFIINLCLADIFITVISMPIWLIFLLYGSKSAILYLGETFVTIWRHVDIMCGTASILSLTSISVDRYIAVSRPYSYVETITTRRAMHIIGGIWVYSMTVALLVKPLREFKGGKCKRSIRFFLSLFVVIFFSFKTCHSPYCQPHCDSHNVSSENLVLDQLIIPKLIFVFILITCLLDIVLIL